MPPVDLGRLLMHLRSPIVGPSGQRQGKRQWNAAGEKEDESLVLRTRWNIGLDFGAAIVTELGASWQYFAAFRALL